MCICRLLTTPQRLKIYIRKFLQKHSSEVYVQNRTSYLWEIAGLDIRRVMAGHRYNCIEFSFSGTDHRTRPHNYMLDSRATTPAKALYP